MENHPPEHMRNIPEEQIPHGNAMFPLMVHEIETDRLLRERLNCHWHKEIEILTVTKGHGQVHIDDRTYSAKEGSIFFIPPDHLHSITGEKEIPFDFFAVVFDRALLGSFVNDAIQQRYMDSVFSGEVVFPEQILPRGEWERKVRELLDEIREAFDKRETAWELSIKVRLYGIWYLLYLHGDSAGAVHLGHSDHRIPVTRGVIEYIRAHYDSPIFLPELSARFHVSEGHLCRLFKSITRMSVTEYINYYRISMSAALLTESDRDIGQVAGMTGFNNISYFNKVFRKYMHMTPSQFRRSVRES